jgi:hypothetical protein
VGKHSPKLPFVSGDTGDPVINVDDAAWQRIEMSCGWSLAPDMRSDLVRATEEFLLFESLERTAQPLAAVKVTLEAYDKAAGRFFHALFTDPSGPSDSSVYAHHLIESNFKESRLINETVSFDALLNLLRAFHIACNVSLRQLNDHSVSAFKSGNGWRLWVWRLTKIVDKAGLSSSVRKDVGSKSKEDRQSPFVRFVWELQQCLPEECRRHIHSMGALADAISEAQSVAIKLGGN